MQRMNANMTRNASAGSFKAGPKVGTLALDRMSNEALIKMGLATIIPAWRSLSAVKSEAPWPPVAAEIPGIIYVLRAPPVMAVKIGFTRAAELAHRLKGLQTGNPYPLQIVTQARGLPAQEREIHKTLRLSRLTGEWFEWTPEVERFVEKFSDTIAARYAALRELATQEAA